MLTSWKSCCVRVQQRWIFAVMCLWAVANGSAMKFALSLSITEMVQVINSTAYSDEACAFLSNSSTVSMAPRHIAAGVYDWDEKLQGLILSSFFWGYICTQLPAGVLAEKFGGKYVLGLGILSAGILTLLIPFTIDIGGSTGLILFRFLSGLADGVMLPSTTVLLSQWAPPSERSKMGSVVFSGSIIGALMCNGIAGFLSHYSPLGWRSVFYFFGSLSIVWFFAWLLLCYSKPEDHPFISEKEKRYLHDAINEHKHKSTPPPPWRHILRSVPFWALVVSLFGQEWGCFTLALDWAKYGSSILKLPVKTNGLVTGIILFLSWIAGIGFSCLADWMINRGLMSRTNVRKLFSSISTLGTGGFLVAMIYAGCDRLLAIGLYVVGVILLGGMYPGMRVNILDLSPNYSGTLAALIGTISAISGILSPYMVGVLTPDQTIHQWKLVFWIVLVIYCVTNFVYVNYASGNVQLWNDPEFLIREREEQSDCARGKKSTQSENGAAGEKWIKSGELII